jgi:hypothetical protein
MTEQNPWLTAAKRAAEAANQAPSTPKDDTERSPETLSSTAELSVTGASRPQAGVASLGPGDGLPVRVVRPGASLWVVGAHGGAGESSIAALVEGWQAAEHAWPDPADVGQSCPCVLVARTHAYGLRAAQAALRQWASGTLSEHTRLLGLVLVPDASGRLPKPLRDLSAHVAGGAPRTWQFSWLEPWRTGEQLGLEDLPRSARQVLADLTNLSTQTNN